MSAQFPEDAGVALSPSVGLCRCLCRKGSRNVGGILEVHCCVLTRPQLPKLSRLHLYVTMVHAADGLLTPLVGCNRHSQK